jgi:hypothetical protein
VSDTIEHTLWGIPAGESDRLHEKVLFSGDPKYHNRVRELASLDGFHSFRVTKLDLSQNPSGAFVRGIRNNP